MEYFIDTEFLEGTQKESFPINLIRKETKPTIDLISIGIISEDNREYYAISKDFNLKEAWNRFDEKIEIMSGDMRNRFPKGRKYKVYWIRENVLYPIFWELYQKEYPDEASGVYGNIGNFRGDMERIGGGCSILKKLISKYGKANKEIAKEVKDFCTIGTAYSTMDKTIADILYFRSLNSEVEQIIKDKKLVHVFSEKPEFYAYFADYDWVVFCQLFGKMIDLPKGFPMFAFDIQQQIEEYKIDKELLLKEVPQINSHNSLSDAFWNKNAYEWIQNKISNEKG